MARRSGLTLVQWRQQSGRWSRLVGARATSNHRRSWAFCRLVGARANSAHQLLFWRWPVRSGHRREFERLWIRRRAGSNSKRSRGLVVWPRDFLLRNLWEPALAAMASARARGCGAAPRRGTALFSPRQRRAMILGRAPRRAVVERCRRGAERDDVHSGRACGVEGRGGAGVRLRKGEQMRARGGDRMRNQCGM